jgi:hypothetical protein
MRAVRDHFAQHRSHLLGCGVAGLLVVAAVVFSIPILAVFGALMCGVMMVGMVWMMFSMVSSEPAPVRWGGPIPSRRGLVADRQAG